MNLVILAAGMGSRFGGLKQLEPVGPNGELIIDYSIYDAVKVGFKKIIFIIKEENLDIFKSLIGSKVEKYIKVEYAIQNNDNVPDKYKIKNREKPLGTAHAIMCAEKYIDDKFMVINADDFYGRQSFEIGYKYLKNEDYGLVGYKIEATLSENGKVKRGVCEVNNGYLSSITECSVEKIDDKIYISPLDSNDVYLVESATVSMNMLMFDKSIFKYLKEEFKLFLENGEDEFFIPNVLCKVINDGHKKCRVLNTSSRWYGMTYKEDLKRVKDNILNLINKGVYPNKLWK